ncbi:hypothetical protein RhiXN_01389 [Rhizoctonia solani]|uniref:CCHC-type domain-containing protein n=1 Tax=Rhizoctonia solani TaxID=456999 RepID=A0A8H8P765_9AGAM|nr:uncharacterized protein RhiXN_01389 [Rhizoctonia solani]QRW26794.1 hypothetical protein RhiXN_01389 [Rhizoctonia solani]
MKEVRKDKEWGAKRLCATNCKNQWSKLEFGQIGTNVVQMSATTAWDPWVSEGQGTTSSPYLPPLPPAPPHVLPPRHPPTLAGPTPHILWQPAPGHPLEPAPLLIRESWDPSFRQPPLSLAKSHLSGSSAFFGGSNPKSTISNGPFWNKPKLNILQTVNTVKDGLARLQHAWGPHTPEEQKPPAVKETPRAAPKAKPIGKALPFLGGPAPIISTGAPRRNPLSLFNPYPSSSFPLGPAPAPQGPPPAPVITPAQPPAPSTVKVDHPDAFKGKIGLEAKQWLTRMLAWVRLNQQQFPLDLEVLSFLLMNMTEAAGAWAHPHLDQLGSHCALIQSVDEFKNEFLAAFGNPDAIRAAEQKSPPSPRPALMELNWNDAALRGQFAQGLHWEVQRQIATRERQPRTLRELQDASLIIDNALREERASHPQQGNKPSKTTTTPNWGASTGQQATKTGPLSSNPNYVLEEERNRRRAEGLCVKCGKPGHKFAECQTGWKATPKEDKGKAKETAKTGKDSEYQSGKE